MKTSADVAIVGGGVIGLPLARELSSRGADVLFR
jgi:glycine/D-amino acid oxidase-like deaminating enzyme